MAVVRELLATFGVKTDKGSINSVEQSINGLKRSAVALGTLFVSGAAAKGFTSLVGFASDANEDMNVLRLGFGNLTDDAIKWSRATADAVGRSEFEVRNFVGRQQLMLQSMLGNRQEAAKFSKELTKLAFDIGSAFNVKDQEAIRALQSAVAGATEPMRRFGVVMTQAALDQFALRKGIGKTVQEMTEEEKVALRINFLMEKTRQVQGDAANTANEYANALKGLQGKIKEVATRVGQFFLKSATRTVVRLRELAIRIRDWIEANNKLIQQRVSSFIEKTARVLGALGGAIATVVRAIVDFVSKASPLQKTLLKISAAAIGLAAVLLIPGGSLLLLIALIGLIIEDFEVFRRGGKSVTGDLIKAFGELRAKVKVRLMQMVQDLKLWLKDNAVAIRAATAIFAGFAAVILAAYLKMKAGVIASFVATQAAAIATAIKAGAAWLAATLPLALWVILLGIVAGALIFIIRELARLVSGQENFFTTMNEGFQNLVADLGGIGPAIGEMLATAFEFWADFFSDILGLTPDFISNMGKTLREFWQTTIEFWGGLFDRFFGGIAGRIKKIGSFFGFGDDKEDATGGAQGAATAAALSPAGRALGGLAAGSPGAIGVSPVASAPRGSGTQVVSNPSTNVSIEMNVPPGLNEEKVSQMVAEKVVAETERVNRQAAEDFLIAAPAAG